MSGRLFFFADACQLAELIDKVTQWKAEFKVRSLALIVNEPGQKISQRAIWERFNKARQAAIIKHPELTERITCDRRAITST